MSKEAFLKYNTLRKKESICLSYVSYVVLTTNKVSNVFGIGMRLVL